MAEAEDLKTVRKGSEVWYYDQAEKSWLKGTVIAESAGKYDVSLRNGETVKGQPAYPANPSFQDDMNDLMQLTHLNDPCLLYNLKSRFEKKTIYTLAGTVLIAVNPFQDLNIYGPAWVNRYRGAASSSNLSSTQSMGRAGKPPGNELDPHIYGVAADAFRRMERENRSQSVVISGESGSGKTESTKHALKYLANLSTPSKSVDLNQVGYEQKVLETNPILEAFGNAKTVRNNNSSRFGKLIQIHFNHVHSIVGASLRTYLLEKSRVSRPSKEERNYHVFYQLIAGAQEDDAPGTPDDQQKHWWWDPAAKGGLSVKEGLRLPDDPIKFVYLAEAETEIRGVNDQQEYHDLSRALKNIGFTATEVESIMSLVSGVLWLGNIQFKDAANNDPAELEEGEALNNAAHLMGVDVSVLTAALTKEKKKAAREVIETSLQLLEARHRRDALAKAVYNGLFDWLVRKLNTSLNPGRRAKGTSIGILDIFGFENFASNSFEQLCINYANEKLQSQFGRHEIKQRQAEYKEELGPDFPTFPEPENVVVNAQCIQLLEGGASQRVGLFALLDQEATLGRGGNRKGEDFVNSLKQNMKDIISKPETKDLIKFPPRARENFELRHAADRVQYEADEMNAKNQDSISNDVIDLLAGSKHVALAELGEALKAEAAGKKIGTVGRRFRNQMAELEQTLDETDLHFVRCIKPTDKPTPPNVEFNQDKVMDQLKCAGISTVASIAKAGFPTRYGIQQFASMYNASNLEPEVNKAAIELFRETKRWLVSESPSLSDIKELLAAHGIGPDQYQIGKTKIFFRAGTLGKLDDSFAAYKRLMVHVVAMLRCFLLRTHWLRQCQRVQRIQCAWRHRVAVTEYRKLQAEAAERRRLEEERRRKEEEERVRKEEEARRVAEEQRRQEEERVRREAELAAMTAAQLAEQQAAEERARAEAAALEAARKAEEERARAEAAALEAARKAEEERQEQLRKEREEQEAAQAERLRKEREEEHAAAMAAAAAAAAAAVAATCEIIPATSLPNGVMDRGCVGGVGTSAAGAGTPAAGARGPEVTLTETTEAKEVLSPFVEVSSSGRDAFLERAPSFTLGQVIGQESIEVVDVLLEMMEEEQIIGHKRLAELAYFFLVNARAIGDALTTLKSVQYHLIRVPYNYDFTERYSTLLGDVAQFKHNFREELEGVEEYLEPEMYRAARNKQSYIGFWGGAPKNVDGDLERLQNQLELIRSRFFEWLVEIEGALERVQVPSRPLPGQSQRYPSNSVPHRATAPAQMMAPMQEQPAPEPPKRTNTVMGWLGSFAR